MIKQPIKKQLVTVGDFIEASRDAMKLKLVSGEAGLKRRINEAAVNRPGLALTGFYKYFANRRIQVLGLAEISYLASLSASQRSKCLRQFFSQKIPCVVFTRGKQVPPDVIKLAKEFRVPVLRTPAITKDFINATTIVMENLSAPRTKIQGTMMEIMGIGVLIDGAPGIGKSDTALALIRKGNALVSDDVTSVRVDSAGSIIASPVSITRYHMEIRGLGIIHVPSLYGVSSVRNEKKLDAVITLCSEKQRAKEFRGGDTFPAVEILGVEVPHIVIAVIPGRDIANIVEAATLDMKLKRLGHDAEKELDEKLVRIMTGGQVFVD
jgi:HPr kinase/phosphorylase